MPLYDERHSLQMHRHKWLHTATRSDFASIACTFANILFFLPSWKPSPGVLQFAYHCLSQNIDQLLIFVSLIYICGPHILALQYLSGCERIQVLYKRAHVIYALNKNNLTWDVRLKREVGWHHSLCMNPACSAQLHSVRIQKSFRFTCFLRLCNKTLFWQMTESLVWRDRRPSSL